MNRNSLRASNNSEVLKDQSLFFEIESGWGGLMKGEVENEGWGLIHRSPLVREAGTWRVVLKIDLLEDA